MYIACLYKTIISKNFMAPFKLSSSCLGPNLGQGDCCVGRCQCRGDENGHLFRHNGTIENCACPPREVVCDYQVSLNEAEIVQRYTHIHHGQLATLLTFSVQFLITSQSQLSRAHNYIPHTCLASCSTETCSASSSINDLYQLPWPTKRHYL